MCKREKGGGRGEGTNGILQAINHNIKFIDPTEMCDGAGMTKKTRRRCWTAVIATATRHASVKQLDATQPMTCGETPFGEEFDGEDGIVLGVSVVIIVIFPCRRRCQLAGFPCAG